jgi:hypothetical protein
VGPAVGRLLGLTEGHALGGDVSPGLGDDDGDSEYEIDDADVEGCVGTNDGTPLDRRLGVVGDGADGSAVYTDKEVGRLEGSLLVAPAADGAARDGSKVGDINVALGDVEGEGAVPPDCSLFPPLHPQPPFELRPESSPVPISLLFPSVVPLSPSPGAVLEPEPEPAPGMAGVLMGFTIGVGAPGTVMVTASRVGTLVGAIGFIVVARLLSGTGTDAANREQTANHRRRGKIRKGERGIIKIKEGE